MDKFLLVLLAASVPVYWTFGWFLLVRLRFLPDDRSGAHKFNGKLSIIIPVRNEEKNLPVLLRSLEREQAFSLFEVIVADDGSTDLTADIAVKAGCRVVTVKDKPGYAQGKSWACAQAADHASGEYLLFLDADTSFVCGGLARVLTGYNGGLLSVQPYHRFIRFYESLSAFFNIMSMAGVNSFCLHSKPGSERGAFGPCMLSSRADYDAAGGHGAILSALVDDVELAKSYRAKGLRVENFGGRGSVEYRMYPGGISELFAGWMKNIAPASGESSGLSGLYFGLLCAGITCCGLLVPFAVSLPLLIPVPAVFYLLFAFQVYIILRRLGSWNPAHALLFPLHLVFFLTVLVISAVKTKLFRVAEWKGRIIKL